MEAFLGDGQWWGGGLPCSLFAFCRAAVAVPAAPWCVHGAGTSPLASLLPFAPGLAVTIGSARSAKDMGGVPGLQMCRCGLLLRSTEGNRGSPRATGIRADVYLTHLL